LGGFGGVERARHLEVHQHHIRCSFGRLRAFSRSDQPALVAAQGCAQEVELVLVVSQDQDRPHARLTHVTVPSSAVASTANLSLAEPRGPSILTRTQSGHGALWRNCASAQDHFFLACKLVEGGAIQ
jgi:hypothetical protein